MVHPQVAAQVSTGHGSENRTRANDTSFCGRKSKTMQKGERAYSSIDAQKWGWKVQGHTTDRSLLLRHQVWESVPQGSEMLDQGCPRATGPESGRTEGRGVDDEAGQVQTQTTILSSIEEEFML